MPLVVIAARPLSRIRTVFLPALLAFIGVSIRLLAGPDTNGVINYQGRVVVGAQLFNGLGGFKFALVNGDGTITYWRNATSSAASGEPDRAVSAQVDDGLYSVVLGDTTVSNMAPIPASVFTSAAGQTASRPLFLRVWFNDGVNGSQVLTPDQRVTPVSFSQASAFSATVADGSVGLAQLAPGTLAATNLTGILPAQALPPGLARSADLAGLSNSLGGQLAGLQQQVSVLAAGSGTNPPPNIRGLTLVSADPADSGLMAAGYRPFFSTPQPAWVQGNSAHAPGPRIAGIGLWTGGRFLVWGGLLSSLAPAADGGLYDPLSDVWTPVAPNPAIVARSGASAVWADGVAIVWGGLGTAGELNSGGIFDPAQALWTKVTTGSGAPSPRLNAPAVWTGKYMAIWGGQDGVGGLLNDLFLYDPAADAWIAAGPSATGTPPSGAAGVTAVWTGASMILFGGQAADGGSIAVAADITDAGGVNWRPISAVNRPSPRSGHVAIWTGRTMVIWGGQGAAGPVGDGALYDPVADTWTPLSTVNAPAPAANAAGVWTGQEVLIAGGRNAVGPTAAGGAYDPASDTWRSLATAGNPTPRMGASAVWTGAELLLFGGQTAAAANGGPFPWLSALQRLNPQPVWYFYRHL
jgi:N-acetylneuraminic acid mutarotase